MALGCVCFALIDRRRTARWRSGPKVGVSDGLTRSLRRRSRASHVVGRSSQRAGRHTRGVGRDRSAFQVPALGATHEHLSVGPPLRVADLPVVREVVELRVDAAGQCGVFAGEREAAPLDD